MNGTENEDPVDWNSEAEVKKAQVVLEQYKAYVGDLGNIGARYAAVHTLYFTLLGATVAVLGLTESGKALGPLRPLTVAIVALFGIGLCGLWIATVSYYRANFAAKFRVLREIEKSLPVKPYLREAKLLGIDTDRAAPVAPRPKVLTMIEQVIPYVFIGLILILGVSAFFAERPPGAEPSAPVRKR